MRCITLLTSDHKKVRYPPEIGGIIPISSDSLIMVSQFLTYTLFIATLICCKESCTPGYNAASVCIINETEASEGNSSSSCDVPINSRTEANSNNFTFIS